MTGTPREARLLSLYVKVAIFWLLVTMLAGILNALRFMAPDFLGGISWLSYGRVRLIHTNAAAFGWITTIYLALMFYMVPRLTGAELYLGEKLGKLVLWAWTLIVAAGLVGFALGYNQGIEYGEFSWPIDILVVVAFLVVIVMIFGAIFKRREQQLYVSLWYLMGGLVWTALNYLVGNSVPVYLAAGVNSAAIAGFYIHNVVGLWVTPIGLAVIYYFLPVSVRSPLYSHKLSLIGFWTLAFLYPLTGAHHFIYSGIADWVETVAIVSSVALIIPVWTVVVNFFGTVKGNWWRFSGNLPMKFFVLGVVFYVMTCLQGPLQALRTLQQIVHFTDWVVGHAHMALFGVFSLWSIAAIYYMWPRLTGRELYSMKLAHWHFWLTAVGFGLMGTTLWAVGLLEGSFWQTSLPFVSYVRFAKPFWWIRLVSGIMMALGTLLFFYNLHQTERQGRRLQAGEAPVSDLGGRVVVGA
ncbi:MAG: cbb3-type cytochrome c oxidase subunit I [Candidatus Tectomicrobia bacterium]|nr:cbb3-type cytochrome c oxidase subunit I [Candidatus Tectomicrobia bacterium]